MLTSLTAVPGTSDVSVQADNAARHAKLMHAAQQFEAVMLGELMKPLSKSSAVDGEEGEQSGNAMQGYGVEAMAGALAQSGALGFAHRMVAAVEGQYEKSMSEKNTVPAHGSVDAADDPMGGK
ncbi:hypothetical protein Terro_1851 [Terriglobus roseus DSM 18391]|uniref:Rod binding protein n=1 Tax=Terriglobus roseus (strain DSM 18391 / NRRL B-41598 / KBS 63) TaxID=926566 RepID=I3ZFX5_TERRK|nr:hypothetical protein [Terriglobus roseus]AFL88143.1 hypothetical protein Terro_1851 [Terriglobus roseus DSM 18391]